ncbi:hypothetical protein CBR_g9145 [Chara braunii]|uniref:Uncharacterized protein n=1 Tax=Chara braunii TaxID=69332 RepID=A0A388KNX3_CHABU|nr:hypothetical protein CBR_g9145 [Chara braunii]|eukprot:GBG71735.1 hypothetical protein CBR_g9145 [Chara braunii]
MEGLRCKRTGVEGNDMTRRMDNNFLRTRSGSRSLLGRPQHLSCYDLCPTAYNVFCLAKFDCWERFAPIGILLGGFLGLLFCCCVITKLCGCLGSILHCFASVFELLFNLLKFVVKVVEVVFKVLVGTCKCLVNCCKCMIKCGKWCRGHPVEDGSDPDTKRKARRQKRKGHGKDSAKGTARKRSPKKAKRGKDDSAAKKGARGTRENKKKTGKGREDRKKARKGKKVESEDTGTDDDEDDGSDDHEDDDEDDESDDDEEQEEDEDDDDDDNDGGSNRHKKTKNTTKKKKTKELDEAKGQDKAKKAKGKNREPGDRKGGKAKVHGQLENQAYMPYSVQEMGFPTGHPPSAAEYNLAQLGLSNTAIVVPNEWQSGPYQSGWESSFSPNTWAPHAASNYQDPTYFVGASGDDGTGMWTGGGTWFTEEQILRLSGTEITVYLNIETARHEMASCLMHPGPLCSLAGHLVPADAYGQHLMFQLAPGRNFQLKACNIQGQYEPLFPPLAINESAFAPIMTLQEATQMVSSSPAGECLN